MRNYLSITTTALTLLAAPAKWAQTAQKSSFDDAHVHLNDPAAWVRLMDETGIGRAVVFRGRDIDNVGLLEGGKTMFQILARVSQMANMMMLPQTRKIGNAA